MTVDYRPGANERRERWLLAIAGAFVLQLVAVMTAVAAFALMFSDYTGADIADGWYIGLAVVAVCVFAWSGWTAARVSESRLGWLTLTSPVLCWLGLLLITRT